MEVYNKLEVAYRSPSNIAFVKYWGKKDKQVPLNSSISMTLKNCFSDIKLSAHKNLSGKCSLELFLFEEKEDQKFKTRINKFIHDNLSLFPSLANYNLFIESSNSFPHSAGIASSASAMSALALCLHKVDCLLSNNEVEIEKVSNIARLASGSASRSVYPSMATWEVSSHESAKELLKIHPSFHGVKDCILLVDSNEKSVSSSKGHSLMSNHPFMESRIVQANKNCELTKAAIESGDWKLFGDTLELEALTLHALMMSSTPSYVLLKPNSLSIIEKVREFRSKSGLDLYFTIDAGPNIHLIYPEAQSENVNTFIIEELKEFCEDGKMIFDEMGSGPKLLHVSHE